MTTIEGLSVERHWDGSSWHWRTFPPPKPGLFILSAPGGCINDRSIFFVVSDHTVWELYRESNEGSAGFPNWIWVAHGAPSSAHYPIVPTQATAMNNKCLFF